MHWEDQLDSILAEDYEAARRRERSAFDVLSGQFAPSIVLYGAGNLGRTILRGLRVHNVEPLAFVDAHPAMAGTTMEGIPVLSPAEAVHRYGKNSVFVVCVWHPERIHGTQAILDRLQAQGAHCVVSFVPLLWKYSDTFLPFYLWDLPSRLVLQRAAIVNACRALSDEGSRTEFVRQVHFRSQADFSLLSGPAEEPSYFPADLFRLREDECFVDCGAFVGDTLRDFLQVSEGRFRKIVAFEPDPSSFAALRALIESHELLGRRTAYYQAAVGDSETTVNIAATGDGSTRVSGEGAVEVACRSLDSAVFEERPTFIKMDIEGSEPLALAGGKRTIQSCNPLLAVCVYHQQDHLWNLPLLMRELAPESSLSLRAYRRDGFDLVCFAVPPARRIPPLPSFSYENN